MKEALLDVLLAAVLLAGAALQSAWPGSQWLLACGVGGLGLRMVLAIDTKRAQLSAVSGMGAWLVFHILLVHQRGGAGKFAYLADVFILGVIPAMFWAMITHGRDVNEAAKSHLVRLRERKADYESKLLKLEGESGGLQTESEEWTRLFGVTKSIGGVIRVDEMVELVKETVRLHLKQSSYILLLAHNGSMRIRGQEGFDPDVVTDFAFATGSATLASWFAKQREPLLLDDLRQDGRFNSALFPFRAAVILPMWVRDSAVGVLLAFDEKPRAFSRADFTRSWILGNQLALGVGKAFLYEKVEELSITDGLTRLYRHRYFQERLDLELDRARRYGRVLSFLMADLDHFKIYNDTYGHPEGDSMLVMVSRIMEGLFRPPAILSRYGGEEFAILLPETPKERALEMADKLRAALAAAKPPCARAKSPMTISIGVASFPGDAQVKRDLVARADQALYKAKSAGRNKVMPWEASEAKA